MSSGQRTFLGHPLGLYVLFTTEMWERFSYYGMRGLLILYMINFFKWEQGQASQVYKIYTSLVYVTPILGGYLADRFLGNRKAVIIGAILMAIGHFLMAFEAKQIFYSALVFLIIGNGFFKPNMSTQVGRLYPANDPRRDGAYTIFYMGINLGAFLAPLLCGWLAENTLGGFHSGFTLAGLGMVVGLVTYVGFQPLVKEIHGAEAVVKADAGATAAPGGVLSEMEAAAAPSAFGALGKGIPQLLAIAAVVVPAVLAVLLWSVGRLDYTNITMLGIGVACLLLMAWICGQVEGGLRDRVVAIVVLGLFVIFFWAAFEQAGNVQNLWADKTTNRYMTREPLPPPIKPALVEDTGDAEESSDQEQGVLSKFLQMFKLKPPPATKNGEGDAKEDGESTDAESSASGLGGWLVRSLNPVPTTWFQSINAVAIFLIAPVFAWMWVKLDKRGLQPSIPAKMALGLILMSASMAIMMAAASQENKPTSVEFAGDLPPDIVALEDGRIAHQPAPCEGVAAAGEPEPFHAGRLKLAVEEDGPRQLQMLGVLPDNERERLVAASAPIKFRDQVNELQKLSEKISSEDSETPPVITLDAIPPGFDLSYAGIKKSILEYDPVARTLTAKAKLAEKEVKGLLVAAGQPDFRDAVDRLFVQSADYRVSAAWLFWSYILATLGELCLSPVGLSMVSKLAPARFATMLMGMWMLTSAFGNFTAGAMGEVWGTIPPIQFFLISTVVLAGVSLVLYVLVKKIVASMHGVN